MKKSLSFLLVLSLIFPFAAPVLAQNRNTAADDVRTRFMTKLDAIQDVNKKNLITRIDQLIAQVNANRTAIMLRHLDTIENVLNQIQDRANSLANSGKDISSVSTAITKARTAIASARSMVQTQAAKVYTLNITTESNLGRAVSDLRIQFTRDLQAANKAVVAARMAVKDVLIALSKIAGETLEDTTNK